jgi:hypothetical protein
MRQAQKLRACGTGASLPEIARQQGGSDLDAAGDEIRATQVKRSAARQFVVYSGTKDFRWAAISKPSAWRN